FLGTSKPGEVIVFRHTNLFYWWPVWFFGYVMALFTYFNDAHMAIVPVGTIPTTAIDGKAFIDGKETSIKDRDVLLLAEGKTHLTRKDSAGQPRVIQPSIYVAQQKSVGTVFLFILIIVIGITNVHMRGLWSFYVLLVIILLTIIAAVAGWWENIFAGL